MIVANREETVVVIPVTVPIVEVEVALRIVPVEVRHVAIATHLTNGTLCKKSSIPPPPEFSKGCIYFVTLIYHQFFAPTCLCFLKTSSQHSLKNLDLSNSHCKGRGQITQSRNLGFFTCRNIVYQNI